ncbi:GIY-YIG nuclease family protein [Paenibacillus allorhizosphaerae]|uniref:GIY-YIG domain-containing protein n=1 Tax=Paenibacillus allorhizosphaerae TaxID=2849866 RepID=A0ABM8VU51_9BACL|nr:GIY-YIG nuclease family protein [Paenibacillus allorhizosphaerae]CAG7658373.1 hypothetical protein PAECIP111802_07025 [Paenibacillus allorhizosphaerae]
MQTKKEMIDQWLTLYHLRTVQFPPLGTLLENKFVIEDMEKLLEHQSFSDSIYVLRMKTNDGFIPIYIGRSNSPVSRWKSHLDGLKKGKALYKRWRHLLLDSSDCLKQTLELIIILDREITAPPIPSFPCTIGSVEYQLVSLASDAYPDFLLNHEGNRR